MCQINILEAKTNFSKLIALLEAKEEDEVIICKSNKPIAKLTLIPEVDVSKRFGIARGRFEIPADFDSCDNEISAMFNSMTGEDE